MSRWLFVALLIYLPINLFLKGGTDQASVHGLVVDYLLLKLYVVDLICLALLGVWWRTAKPRVKLPWSVWALIALVVVQFLLWKQPAILLGAGRVLLFGWVGWWLSTQSKLWQSRAVTWVLALTLIGQSILGLTQYINQSHLAPYWLLGETRFSQPTQLAYKEQGSSVRVLPYGSTAHPNILAGVLVFYGAWLLWRWPSTYAASDKKITITAIIIGTLALVLTESVSGWLAALTWAMVFLYRSQKYVWLTPVKLGWLVLVLNLGSVFLLELTAAHWPAISSLTRRAYLQAGAWKMWQQHPALGVGFGQFTRWIEQYADVEEVVRFVQPAHQSSLLWLAELGSVGVGLILWNAAKLCNWLYRRAHLVLILPFLPLWLWDHYLLTSVTGVLLVTLTLAIPVTATSPRAHGRQR